MSVVQVTVQQVMLYAQIQLLHVTVQAVAQCLIVEPVLLIHMVYAVTQYVVVILAAKHMMMVYNVQLVRPVVVALALMSQQVPLAMVARLHIIAATAQGHVQHHMTLLPVYSRHIIGLASQRAVVPDTPSAWSHEAV